MLSQRSLIKDAMVLAAACITKDEFDLSSEIEALDFRPELVLVRDSLDRRVIAGRVEGQRICWCDPVSSQGEVVNVAKQVEEFCDEATCEAG